MTSAARWVTSSTDCDPVTLRRIRTSHALAIGSNHTIEQAHHRADPSRQVAVGVARRVRHSFE